MHLLAWASRFRYYGSWTLMEANMIAAGVGWDGTSWEPVRNIHVLRAETALDAQQFLKYWNCSVQHFIQNCPAHGVTRRRRTGAAD